MSKYTYNQIIKVAENCQNNIKKENKIGITSKWSYFFAKAILQPNRTHNKFNYPASKNPNGDYLSRQITKTDYLDCCKRLVKFVETRKYMPNYISWRNFKLDPVLFTEVLSRIILYYDNNKQLPHYANVNSKVFKEEIETDNAVYNYFVKKTGKKPKTVDETLTYISNNFVYEGYNDDKYSNKEVIDKKKGNCVDLLQFLTNMAKAEGYETRCIHVKCRQSGTGHVFGQFKHKIHTENTWITRDPAAVAGGNNIRKIWCENGIKLATDPKWFLANLNR